MTRTFSKPFHSEPNWDVPLGAALDNLDGRLLRVAYDVREYGAAGDGITNDTAAISDAIAAMAASGSALYFPAGNYLVTQVLLSGLTGFAILGEGATITGSDQTQAILRLSGCANFEIRGLQIAHASATVRNSTGYGIHMSSCTDYLIAGCSVSATAAAGIISQTGTRGTVVGCRVRNTLADGIHHTGGSTHITVTGCHTDTTGDDGIAVVSYQSDGAICSDITISGNTVVQSKARGIAVVGGQGVQVTGNTVRATKSAGIYVAQETAIPTRGVLDVAVTGNLVKDANTYSSPPATLASIHIAGMDGTFTVDTVLVASNLVWGGGWYGVYAVANSAGQVKHVSVQGNFLLGPATAGDGMRFVSIQDSAILGNVVRYAFDSGIFIDSACTDIQVDHNSIFKPNQGNTSGKWGVNNNATTGSSVLNIITADTGKTALSAEVTSTDGSGNALVRRNIITNNQVQAGAATRAFIVTSAGGGVYLPSLGSLNWVPDANAGGSTPDATLARGGANLVSLTLADLDIATVGRGLRIAEGTNAKMGTATLNGTTAVTISTTAVTANSRILLTIQAPGGTPASPYVSARTAGTSFQIKSTGASDTSTVAWMIVEPG